MQGQENKSEFQPVRIERRLGVLSALLSIECTSGVTIVDDIEGTQAAALFSAFSSSSPGEGARIFQSNSEVPIPSCMRLGFGEEIPNDITVSEYLKRGVVSESEITKVLEKHELRKFSSFACGALSSTAARQLQLLAILFDPRTIVLLNDPFQPFSGRWREHFAQLLLSDAIGKNKTLIVTNLSFLPKCWEGVQGVAVVDAAAKARESIARILLHEEQARERAKREAKLAVARQEDADNGENASNENLVVGEPASIKDLDLDELCKGRKSEKDWLWGPLIRASNFLRTYSGAGAVLSIAGVVCLLAVMLFPDLSAQRAILVRLGTNFSSLWRPDSTGLDSHEQSYKGEEKRKLEIESDSITHFENNVEQIPNEKLSRVGEMSNPGIDLSAQLQFHPESFDELGYALIFDSPICQSLVGESRLISVGPAKNDVH